MGLVGIGGDKPEDVFGQASSNGHSMRSTRATSDCLEHCETGDDSCAHREERIRESPVRDLHPSRQQSLEHRYDEQLQDGDHAERDEDPEPHRRRSAEQAELSANRAR